MGIYRVELTALKLLQDLITFNREKLSFINCLWDSFFIRVRL